MFVKWEYIKNTVASREVYGLSIKRVARFKRPDKSHLNSVGSSEVHSRSKYNWCKGGGAHFVLLDCALI